MLYGAGKDSGTYDYFTTAVVGTQGQSRPDYTASEDDYLLAQDLAADPAGLGFFGYAYYVEYSNQLHAVAIDNGAGCVAPSPTTIADGSYQPLSRPIFLYVRADALDRPELQAFVSFYLANGPALVRSARYVTLPERAYALAQKRLDRRLTGSVFAGGSQVGVSIEQLLELEGK
jgi:phosphate transport system substrate-binding protein